SRSDYHNRANSYLNEVIDDREGLPLSLSILYMELGRRLGLKIVGVGLPGHFVVRHVPSQGEPQLIDVFGAGTPISRSQADERVEASTGGKPKPEHFAAITKKAIILRMLNNLLAATPNTELPRALRYLDAMLAVDPDSVDGHLLRASTLYQTGDRQ